MNQSARGSRETVESLRTGATDADPARPLLTWYDDTTGERVELSGLTLDNWVAKTANLLADGCGLRPGDGAAGVVVRPHWQTAAIMLGCWAAGLVVDVHRRPMDPIVIFAEEPVDSAADDRFLLGLAPMGLPLRAVPDGWQDYVAEVRGHGDQFAPWTPVDPDDGATVTDSHRDLVAKARAAAAEIGIPPGGRVLVDAATHPDALDWLLAPLAVRASIVLCRDLSGLDPAALAARVAAERVDITLGRPGAPGPPGALA